LSFETILLKGGFAMPNHELHFPGGPIGVFLVTEEQARIIRARCDKIIEEATKPSEVQVSLTEIQLARIADALAITQNHPSIGGASTKIAEALRIITKRRLGVPTS
jgi:hypothetical protein